MKHLQDIIEERAKNETVDKIRNLFTKFSSDCPSRMGFLTVKTFYQNKPVEFSGDMIFRALQEAMVEHAVPPAQEQAAKEFIAKVERLGSEIEEIQSLVA